MDLLAITDLTGLEIGWWQTSLSSLTPAILHFSELCHYIQEVNPANTMAYDILTIFIRIIVRIHTRCDFFILFLSLRKPRANDNDQINYLAIRKGSSRCFIRIRISNSYKSVRSAKTFKSEKVGLPPLPRYVGTCKNMYKKILATFRKSGLYSLTRVAYSQPQYTNLQISVSCLC